MADPLPLLNPPLPSQAHRPAWNTRTRTIDADTISISMLPPPIKCMHLPLSAPLAVPLSHSLLSCHSHTLLPTRPHPQYRPATPIPVPVLRRLVHNGLQPLLRVTSPYPHLPATSTGPPVVPHATSISHPTCIGLHALHPPATPVLVLVGRDFGHAKPTAGMDMFGAHIGGGG